VEKNTRLGETRFSDFGWRRLFRAQNRGGDANSRDAGLIADILGGFRKEHH
jgi:hypothetical protein